MAESALGTRSKIRPPCTLKHRVQQEYNSLLVKSNLSLNNFKWLLTKLELSCVRNIIPRSRKRLCNRYPVLKSRPRWAAHTHFGNVWEYPPGSRSWHREPKDRNIRLPSFFYLCGIAVWGSFCHGKRLVFCDFKFLNTLQL